MTHYSEIAARQNHLLSRVTLALALGGFALYIAAAFTPYALIVQLISVALLAFSVMLFVRRMIEYTYTIATDENDGAIELRVISRKGKRLTTLCRLNLSDLQEARIVSYAERKEASKRYYSDRIWSYCPDLCPARSVYLVFVENGQRIVLCIQPSDALIDCLRTYRPAAFEFSAL